MAAVFILVNSTAGLAGQLGTLASLPSTAMAVWLPMALAGGYLGSHYGSRTLATKNIYRLLALVLIVAAVKLLLTLSD